MVRLNMESKWPQDLQTNMSGILVGARQLEEVVGSGELFFISSPLVRHSVVELSRVNRESVCPLGKLKYLRTRSRSLEHDGAVAKLLNECFASLHGYIDVMISIIHGRNSREVDTY